MGIIEGDVITVHCEQQVTETTRVTIVLNKDGIETRDTIHTLEKSESKASLFTCRKIILLLLVVAGAVLLFLYFTKQKDIMSVDNIMES